MIKTNSSIIGVNKINYGNKNKTNKKDVNLSQENDVFIRRGGLSSDEALFVDELTTALCKKDNFSKIIKAFIEDNYWTNGVDIIGINFKNEQIQSISIAGYTPNYGEQAVVMNQDDFMTIISKMKCLSVKNHPDKKKQYEELYEQLRFKIEDLCS